MQMLDIIQIVIAILLIITILLQNRGSGLGSAFGGEGNIYMAKRGAEKFVRLKNLKDRFLLTSYKYKPEKTDKVVIVIFDVPEKEKWKREWLRNTLRELGMKNVQKSVFIGKVKIPELFLENMRKLHAIDYVEIFEIGKTGTLKHVV